MASRGCVSVLSRCKLPKPYTLTFQARFGNVGFLELRGFSFARSGVCAIAGLIRIRFCRVYSTATIYIYIKVTRP